jgi:hypothetical protein
MRNISIMVGGGLGLKMFLVMGLWNWCRTHKILHYQIVFGLKLLEFITCFLSTMFWHGTWSLLHKIKINGGLVEVHVILRSTRLTPMAYTLQSAKYKLKDGLKFPGYTHPLYILQRLHETLSNHSDWRICLKIVLLHEHRGGLGSLDPITGLGSESKPPDMPL